VTPIEDNEMTSDLSCWMLGERNYRNKKEKRKSVELLE
jgi:hypothetical protein